MTLHYRKLLIASIAFPIIVVGLLAFCLPSLMHARSASTFGRLRANIKSLEMQLCGSRRQTVTKPSTARW